MKKYNLLITGRGNSIIDDFFNHMSSYFTCITTSLRYEDMEYHVNYFKPDIFVICLNGETKEELARLTELRKVLVDNCVFTIIIGTEEECKDFEEKVFSFQDMAIYKPISAGGIRDRIIEFMAHFEAESRHSHRHEERMIYRTESSNDAYRDEPSDDIYMHESLMAEKKQVLVIDDDPIVLETLKAMLEDDYEVAVSQNGRMARNFINKRPVDVILLDYLMPEEDGPAVYRSLKEMDKAKNVPILFLTGVTDREKIKEVAELKPQGYLLKPLDVVSIKEKIRACLE